MILSQEWELLVRRVSGASLLDTEGSPPGDGAAQGTEQPSVGSAPLLAPLETLLWAVNCYAPSLILGVIACQPSPTGWDLCLEIMGLGLFRGKTITHQSATNRPELGLAVLLASVGIRSPEKTFKKKN